MASRKRFTGSTEGGGTKILGASFWEEGTIVRGTYIRTWESSVGECYEFMAVYGENKPEAYVDEKGFIVASASEGKQIELDKFSIGSLSGFEMAVADLKSKGYVPNFRDVWEVKCVGFQPSSKGSDMVKFAIEIE